MTYDLKNNFCLVRGKRNVGSEVFGRAVATQGIGDVYLVRKNEKKEEVRNPKLSLTIAFALNSC